MRNMGPYSYSHGPYIFAGHAHQQLRQLSGLEFHATTRPSSKKTLEFFLREPQVEPMEGGARLREPLKGERAIFRPGQVPGGTERQGREPTHLASRSRLQVLPLGSQPSYGSFQMFFRALLLESLLRTIVHWGRFWGPCLLEPP